MEKSAERRHGLRLAIKSIREFEAREGLAPVKRDRMTLQSGARSIVSTLADGRRYACGYI